MSGHLNDGSGGQREQSDGRGAPGRGRANVSGSLYKGDDEHGIRA